MLCIECNGVSNPSSSACMSTEQYVTTSGYHAQNPDELSFERGVIVDVLKKGLDGWWRIK